MKKDIIQTAIAICVFIGIILGAMKYFATAEALQATNEFIQLVGTRLDLKINADKIYDLQKRIYQLEDRNGGNDCSKWTDQKDKETYRKVKNDIKQLEEERNFLYKKGVK